MLYFSALISSAWHAGLGVARDFFVRRRHFTLDEIKQLQSHMANLLEDNTLSSIRYSSGQSKIELERRIGE